MHLTFNVLLIDLAYLFEVCFLLLSLAFISTMWHAYSKVFASIISFKQKHGNHKRLAY